MNLRKLRSFLPPRRADCHKGEFGRVLLVAGSRGMAGAAVLAARAALRSGAGLVTAAVPLGEQAVVAGCAPEALTLGLGEAPAEALIEAHKLKGFSVLAVGPGLGVHPGAVRAVLQLLESVRIPAVVDADALNMLALQPVERVRELFVRRGAPCVLTPHPGEAGRLLRITTAQVQADRPGSAARIAEEFGCVCLLKGKGTVVTGSGGTYVNATGNPGLAKGGSGDVLTGLIAGLWAQRPESGGLEAAALGAYLHGLAADIAAREKGERGLLAGDVVEALPAAFRKAGI